MFKLEITESAAKRMLKVSQEQQIYGIKLGIKKTGCAGLEYTWTAIQQEELQKNDKVIPVENTHLIIDHRALAHLYGSKIDHVTGLFSAEFQITNPNAESTCGCGVSLAFDEQTLNRNLEILELK